MVFSPDGARCAFLILPLRSITDSSLVHSLYCGFENAIEIFDVNTPGAAGFRLATTATRGSRNGQKGTVLLLVRLLSSLRQANVRSPSGIISTLAFSSPDPLSPDSPSFLAAGSYSGSIGLYDPSSPTPLFDLLTPSQKGGVTKVCSLLPFSNEWS
jgi:hypothetical protein